VLPLLELELPEVLLEPPLELEPPELLLLELLLLELLELELAVIEEWPCPQPVSRTAAIAATPNRFV
jgi:hypothetical protein